MLVRLFIFSVMLLLNACALSPISLNLSPAQPANIPVVVNGTWFTLRVIDQRPHEHLGNRGGAYANASEINLARSISDFIDPPARQGFIAMGLMPQANLGNAQAQGIDDNQRSVAIELLWTEMSYKSKGGLYPSYMTMAAEFSLVARSTQGEYTNSYRMARDRRFAVVPEAADSEVVLNEFLRDVLALMYQDAGLQQWLARQ